MTTPNGNAPAPHTEASILGSILLGTGSIVSVDFFIEWASCRLARLALETGEPDVAEFILGATGKNVGKTVIPAALLGFATAWADHENEFVAKTARALISPLKAAVQAGTGALAITAIKHIMSAGDTDTVRLRALIAEAKENRRADARETRERETRVRKARKLQATKNI